MSLSFSKLRWLTLPAWVFLGFMVAQVVISIILIGFRALGVSFEGLNPVLVNSILGVIVYGLAIAIVLWLPWLIKRRRATRSELGVQRLPVWTDLLWPIAGMVGYLILTTVIMQLASFALPFVDYNQVQDTGFSGLISRPEYIMAFVSLVIVAPVAEEVLFRGYLFGKLRRSVPLWGSILITSLLFAIVHFQWNVGIDVFALSIVLCLLRVWTGSLWASILLHMLKNGVAYYLLFVNPSLLSTIG